MPAVLGAPCLELGLGGPMPRLGLGLDERGSFMRGGTRVAILVLLAAVGCGGGIHRMPDRPVVWVDNDGDPFSPPPEERYVSWRFDAVDQLFLRPVSEAFAFRPRREAINVNALDEVPDSSWFTNRIGRHPLSAEAVRRGACEAADTMPPLPWSVVGGKTFGSHPGFTIEDADGERWLVKTDGLLQPERASAADAIAAALFHAAGYNVPCNRVAFFTRDDLHIAEGAEAELLGGATIPLTDAIVDAVLEAAVRTPDGRFRGALSRFVEGWPLGPWSHEGTFEGDRNDVIPHELRRDVRGLYVFYAWTGHVDARQENTLSAWIEVDGDAGYVRHYLIDFGDCFGVMHESDRLSRRLGHDHYLNLGTLLVDYLTLGLLERPWRDARLGPAGRVLGYFDAEHFRPDEWAPGYASPAFDAHTEHDAAWMARIVSRFTRDHIEAAVSLGRFSSSVVATELVEVLMGRRERLLERYLTRLSPLAWPRVEGRTLCLEDLAVQSGIRSRQERRYDAVIADSDPSHPKSPLVTRSAPNGVCVSLPSGLTYAAIDLVASTPSKERTFAARVHLYPTGAGYRAVALERLGDHGAVP